jgi:hypothetical protein
MGQMAEWGLDVPTGGHTIPRCLLLRLTRSAIPSDEQLIVVLASLLIETIRGRHPIADRK